MSALSDALGISESDLALLGTLGGGLLGSTSGATQAGTTTTTTSPWEGQQPYLLDAFQKAQQAASYGGTATEDQHAAQSQLGKWASGENMNPMLGVDNPYLQGMVDKGSQDFMRQWQPAVNRANAASGSFGNSGVAETYGRLGSEGLANSIMGTRYQDYNANRGLFESDANRQIGALGGFQTQANYMQQMPQAAVKNYGQTITGNYGNSQTSPYFSNPLAGALGGAFLGSQLGSWGK